MFSSDCLKKATLNLVKVYLLDKEYMLNRLSDFDSDFKQVAPQTCNDSKHVKNVKEAIGVDLADAQKQ